MYFTLPRTSSYLVGGTLPHVVLSTLRTLPSASCGLVPHAVLYAHSLFSVTHYQIAHSPHCYAPAVSLSHYSVTHTLPLPPAHSPHYADCTLSHYSLLCTLSSTTSLLCSLSRSASTSLSVLCYAHAMSHSVLHLLRSALPQALFSVRLCPIPHVVLSTVTLCNISVLSCGLCTSCCLVPHSLFSVTLCNISLSLLCYALQYLTLSSLLRSAISHSLFFVTLCNISLSLLCYALQYLTLSSLLRSAVSHSL